jgi:hypothetical protein
MGSTTTRFCDRCKTETDNLPGGLDYRVPPARPNSGGHGKADLCEACCADFESWGNLPGKARRIADFREALAKHKEIDAAIETGRTELGRLAAAVGNLETRERVAKAKAEAAETAQKKAEADNHAESVRLRRAQLRTREAQAAARAAEKKAGTYKPRKRKSAKQKADETRTRMRAARAARKKAAQKKAG